jgi:hypothetical protein
MTHYLKGNIKNLSTMKKIRHILTEDEMDNRMGLSNQKDTVPKSKLLLGSVEGKYAVILDDGRTVVYITDKSREREIKLRYGLRKVEKGFCRSVKPKFVKLS